jgi:phosphodiesterase/alkaline phosphatase D-like protein
MAAIHRREFLAAAAALGASAAWVSARAAPSKLTWTERRDLFPEGVASGDPQDDSVILWTRRPPLDADNLPGGDEVIRKIPPPTRRTATGRPECWSAA